MIGKEIIFFYKAILFAVTTFVMIPKQYYKKFFIYGFIYGGILDIVIIFILEAFGLIEYKNMGVFNIFDKFSFWTPIAWLFVFMLYFYLLPEKKKYLYPYFLGFTFFGIMVGQVLKNFGLYDIKPIYKYFQPLIIFSWFALSAWIYIKGEQIDLE
jgi:hypothetical protein